MSIKVSHDDVISDGIEYFTNTWAVRILGGSHKARGIAESLGFNVSEEVS